MHNSNLKPKRITNGQMCTIEIRIINNIDNTNQLKQNVNKYKYYPQQRQQPYTKLCHCYSRTIQYYSRTRALVYDLLYSHLFLYEFVYLYQHNWSDAHNKYFVWHLPKRTITIIWQYFYCLCLSSIFCIGPTVVDRLFLARTHTRAHK